MTAEWVLFFVLAAAAISGAVSLILLRHPIHSALSLVVVMVSLAGLYLMLEAEFIAALQIIVYAGAIMVLFVFVIMLLNAGTEERTHFSRAATYAGLPLALFLLIELAYRILHSTAGMVAQPVSSEAMHDMAMLLFQDFSFPFELTSILILIAILGAIVLAKKEE